MNHKQAKEDAEDKCHYVDDVSNLCECYLDLLEAVKGLMENVSYPSCKHDCKRDSVLNRDCSCGKGEAWDRVQKIIGGEK